MYTLNMVHNWVNLTYSSFQEYLEHFIDLPSPGQLKLDNVYADMDWLSGGIISTPTCNIPGFDYIGEIMIMNSVFNSTIV